MMKTRGCCASICQCFFEYSTPKILVIRSFKVGTLNRITQALVIAYVIGYVCVLNKGYQETDAVLSSVTTKVKGIALTNTSDLGLQIWDVADYVIPPQEESSFFVLTNLLITLNQTQSHCPEPVESPSGAGGGLISDLGKFLRSPSTNSSLFLKASHPTKQTKQIFGELEWEEEGKEMGSMFLTKNRTHIQVTVAGLYVVFVQATFKLPAGNDTRDLRLQLDFTYRERTDQFASAFDTRQLLEEEQDAPLSFYVLVRMEPENRLSVMASHRQRVDYERRPVSTFITIIRCSD